MPLFELYRMAKRKLESSQERNPSCSTSLSSVPESDFVELVWDNGQIMTQGQSSRTRKNPTSNRLPSHSPKTGDTDIENGTNTKTGKFGMVESILNEIPMSMPSGEMGLSQDDEMVCWLNYPMIESLQTEYRPNFFSELSGVTANELSTQDNFASSSKGSCNHSTVNSRAASVHNGISSDEGNTLEGSIAGDKATIPRNITSPSSPSHTLQFPTSFPYLRARISQNIGNSISYSPASHAVSGDSIQGATLAGSFPSIRMQKQDPAFPNNRSSTMNFSHFLGPAAFVKANLQNIGAVANPVLSSVEKVGSKDKGAAASSSNPAETLLESTGALRKEASLFCQPIVQSNVDVKHFETKPLDVTDEPPKAVCPGADSKNNKDPCESLGEGTTKRLQDGEKTVEPAVASSSVCSGNSGERASGDPSHDLKRKHCDIEDSECPSEDVEEESVGAKKVVPARAGRGSKRSRAAEVHNLSERRRRDRINEKMRALQELIPNCNKVDKASMLDEAIEYLKTLQLQVQVMSMGAGLYMPHMMLPAGMQHMHAAHMPHFSPMGVGIGMGMGFGMAMPDMNGGSSGCPMVQLPPTHGAQFPGMPMPIPAAMHGMAGPNFQLFGLPGQGLPMSMPHAPLIPMSGGSLMNPAMDLNAQGMMHPMENLDSGRASSSRNLMQNINPQVTQNAGATSSMKQTPAQCQDCQAVNENSKQPDVVQDNSQLPLATSTGAFKSADRNEDRPQSSLL